MVLDLLTGTLGILLAFLAPGLAVAAAVFPEKLRRSAGWEGPLEIAVLGVLGSVAVTILVGSALTATPSGFGASAANPSLWVGNAAVTGIGAVVWYLRRDVVAPAKEGTDDLDAWSTLRSLERLTARERALRRSLRSASMAPAERDRVTEELEGVRTERERLARSVEAAHAS